MRSHGDRLEVRVDPIREDDQQLEELFNSVWRLKSVCQDIEVEAKFQNKFLDQLQETMSGAQAGLKSSMRRLSTVMVANRSNHMLHVVLFALGCSFTVYLWLKYL